MFLNDQSVAMLNDLIQDHKRLVVLDISWNSLLPKQMKKIVDKIGENRRLESINLAWNQILVVNSPEKEQLRVAESLSKAIKRNKHLLHFDLTSTGLPALVIKEIGLSMKRAGSLLAIHLTDNPGLTPENLELVPKTIKCRPVEDIDRFKRIQSHVKQYLKTLQHVYKEGITWKMNKQITFVKRSTEPMQNLIFQRFIGFKEEQPGSGQWYETSQSAVPSKMHYKSDCWICQKHIYSVLLWSRGRAMVLNPIMPATDAEELSF